MIYYLIFSYIFMLGACLYAYEHGDLGCFGCLVMFVLSPVSMPYVIGVRMAQ